MSRPKLPAGLSPRQRRMRILARRTGRLLAVFAAVALLILADRQGVFGRARLGDWEKYHRHQFKVVRIVDGDTLDIDCRDGRFAHTRVRLLGVDAPESVKPDTPVQHYGPEADQFLRGIAKDKTVTLELNRTRMRDTYKRVLAYVIGPDGGNVNEALVATGHGYADPRFQHPLQREFKRAQTEAMKAGRGLWRKVTEADLPYYYQGKLKLPVQQTRPAGGGQGASGPNG